MWPPEWPYTPQIQVHDFLLQTREEKMHLLKVPILFLGLQMYYNVHQVLLQA